MRVLVVLALVAIIVYLVRGLIARRQASRSSPSSAAASPASEPMRQCLHCGAYFPASEAVVHAPDQIFCSEEHRRLHLQNKA